MVSNRLKNQHLLWRAGFGPMIEDLDQLDSPNKSFVADIFKTSAKAPHYIDVANNALKGLIMGMDEVVKQNKQLTEEERRRLRAQSREDIRNLNLTWLNEMVNSKAQLREKMALFWHGHFASRNLNILYQQKLLDVIRQNALGNFGDLLLEVSKSAAMINFLNNNQNRKGHPNENFAREVMELFTMGRGNYTENDVKEAARAFTGWGANIAGEYVFRRFQHDDGRKSFLGKTGNFGGEDILNMLLEQKQTAKFITTKVYRFFVSENIDEEKIQWLADRFYDSGYEIASLMKDIFSSDWFYAEKNIGSRIKSPVELLAGIQRILPIRLENDEGLLLIQRLLGQMLFYPPNVAGWPGGKNWIDSSSLMLRMRIPQMLYGSEDLQMKPKDDDDVMMGKPNKDDDSQMNKRAGYIRQLKGQIQWQPFVSIFEKVSSDKLVPTLSSLLLQTPTKIDESVLSKFTVTNTRDLFIRTATIQLMSTPEYQLC